MKPYLSNSFLLILVSLFVFSSCKKGDENSPTDDTLDFISAVDISSFPEISNTNTTFYNLQGQPDEMHYILKQNGVNTIRLRLWVNPINEHSEFDEVQAFSEELKKLGFKIWLTIHYSDTWADPAQQNPPALWQGISYNNLKDSVYQYTADVVKTLDPDYIQVGNEINTGLLHPYGHISDNPNQFIDLLETGIEAVRTNSNKAKIMMHYAGIEGSEWFYNQISSLDYDIIGLSYYPIWHSKSISQLKNTLDNLSATHQKQMVIAETAYPFTLAYNDWTTNIVGLEEHLILPDYTATPEGQQAFIKTIRSTILEVENGLGFCYWGGELIAWKGEQATDGSPWENQALFNFDNSALPVLNEFISE